MESLPSIFPLFKVRYAKVGATVRMAKKKERFCWKKTVNLSGRFSVLAKFSIWLRVFTIMLRMYSSQTSTSLSSNHFFKVK
ncbi:hypothetical protein DRO26_03355 [Candidatus Bathyarchaeota archaeon]|nr:MAG: hypothetical protein DRO26_03355 [Candidatus Bathyarchaeota archaeon]